MTEEQKLTPIQKLGVAQDRIKELEGQLIQAEDIAKEYMSMWEDLHGMSFFKRLWWAFTRKV